MLIQKIFQKLCMIIVLATSFSLSFDLTPIPIVFYKYYSFSLYEKSKFVIYSFKNEMDPDHELIFRFTKEAFDASKLFLYFSENDVSQNIESLINFNPYTGEFFGSFYSYYLNSISRTNYEIIINSDKCDKKYLMPGYIYAVISCVSTRENPYYSGDILIFNTKYMPVISTSKTYEYFQLDSHYRNDITFLIPEISNDIILRLGYAAKYRDEVFLLIFRNSLNVNNLIVNKTIESKDDNFIALSKGNSYYIKYYYKAKYGYQMYEVLFQFPPDKFIKLEEGKVIFTSSLTYNDYYYFYYENEKMNIGDSLYLKVMQNNDSCDFRYKEILYNDKDYINQRINPDNSKYCKFINKIKINNTINEFYNCKKEKESQIFLFMIKNTKLNRVFPNFKIEMFSKTIINKPDNIQKNFKKEETGFYLLNLKDLSSFNKDILIYSNEYTALNIYCFNLDNSNMFYGHNYRYYTDLRFFFLDPSKPESEKNTSEYISEYYSIFLFNSFIDEYSLDIKFIDKNLYFIQEIAIPLHEKMIRKAYYNNIISNMDIFFNLKYIEQNNEKVDYYSIVYQELYGKFEIDMIILDKIKVKTIDELLYSDFSFNKKYISSSFDPSIIGKYILIHIKISSNKIVPSPFDHIAFYENILKMNFSYTKRLSEGEQIILFPEVGKSIFIYFDTPYNEFNVEIKFLGKANSKEYKVNINICDEGETILNEINKIIIYIF